MRSRLPLAALAVALTLSACGHRREDAAGPATDTAPTPPPARIQSAAAPSASATPVPTPGAAATIAPANSSGGNPTVGGAAMAPSAPIAVNAALAPNLSTLVGALKAADLVGTLAGPGPFTVFAPTNEAFARLAPGTVDSLLKPENKAALRKVLTYHVVPGTITLADLKARIAAGGGSTTLTTAEGAALTVTLANNVMTLTDVNGNKAYVETPDVRQSNGVVHVVNGVLVPRLG